MGIAKVYPLRGGIEAWLKAGYPTDMVDEAMLEL